MLFGVHYEIAVGQLTTYPIASALCPPWRIPREMKGPRCPVQHIGLLLARADDLPPL